MSYINAINPRGSVKISKIHKMAMEKTKLEILQHLGFLPKIDEVSFYQDQIILVEVGEKFRLSVIVSSTSKTCLQHIWSPTSVTNIEITHFSLVWLDKNQRNYSQRNKIWNDIQHGVSTIHFWTELLCSECWKVREVLEIAQKVIERCHNDNLWCVFNRRYSSNMFHLDRWIRL